MSITEVDGNMSHLTIDLEVRLVACFEYQITQDNFSCWHNITGEIEEIGYILAKLKIKYYALLTLSSDVCNMWSLVDLGKSDYD